MQDRITEILAELKGMERQGMSQGGRPISPPRIQTGMAEFDRVAGSEGGRPLTADEYTSQQVDFYDFPGIDVSVAPPADPDDDDDDADEPLRPNILTPVSDREETSVFDAQVISSSGRPRFERLNAQQSLNRFTDKDLDINGDNRFENFIERTKAGAEKIGGGVGLAASAALGPATSGLMLAGASLNRKQQRENANAIMRSNNTGGAIFEFNGQVVSRAPGARNFDGTFANTSNEEMQRLEAISMNAVPGTFFEVPKDDDSGEFQPDPTRIKNGIFKDEQSGIIVDAFGTVHSASGRLTATHGETGRTGVMRAALAAAGVPNYDFNDAQARQFIQTYREGRPFFGTTRGMDKATYDSKLNAFGTTATTILAGMGIGKGGMTPVTTTTGNIAPKAPDGGLPPTIIAAQEEDSGGAAGSGLSQAQRTAGDRYQAMADRGYSGAVSSGNQDENESRSSASSSGSSGGSYGAKDSTGGSRRFAQGGVAAEPAGFVEGPPENFTEKQTVADDKPMSVAEGTFVINAAAVEFAGSDDIKSMLVKAYAKLQKKLDKSPSRVKIPTEDEIDVAVSRGEVIVPPELAKIIGYDRLEKINNRGKKEVSRRQKKAGGGFLAGKKFANGGEVEYEDRIVIDEVRRKMKTLLESLPEDVAVTSKYFADDRPARKEYHEELARLNEVKPMEGRFHSSGKHKRVNVPQTPTLLNLYIMAEEVAHQLGGYGTQPPSPKDVLFGLSKEQRIKKAENRYAEELRAKKIAFDAVGGLFPTDKKTVGLYKDDYGRSFASFVLEAGSPELLAQMAEKYPELKNQINADGTVKKRHTKPSQDFKLAVDAEEARIYDEFKKSTFFQRMNPFGDPPPYVEGYSGADGKPVGSKMASGGEIPKVLPKPSPVRQKKIAARQEAERMADVELRADLEEFIRDDQLARLGWDLYTSGELKVVGVPTPFDYTRVTKGEGEDARETVQDEMSYTYGGMYNAIPGRDTFPVFRGEGRTRVRASDNPRPPIREYLDRVGTEPSAEVPLTSYFAEPMYIPPKGRTYPEVDMADRATVMLTLAHELRHAALNHLRYEYGAPEMTLSTEERVMDYFDQKGRKQASKNNALVLAESPYIKVADRGQSAVKLSVYRQKAELYNELATEVLKLRGVPSVAQPEEKGFISRFIDGLFRKPHPATGTLKKGDGKPTDYEFEAMQSAQF